MAHPLEKYELWYVLFFPDGYMYRQEIFTVDNVGTLATDNSFRVQAAEHEQTHPDNIKILGFEVIETP